MLQHILLAILEYKWMVLIYVLVAVIFCGAIYIFARDFKWERSKVTAFAILYDLDLSGQICLGLLLGRFALVAVETAFGGSTGLWDLIAMELLTIAIVISSRDWKALLQLLSYGAVFAISLLENMMFEYYRNVEADPLIPFVGAMFGLFAFLYAVHQSIVSYERLLGVCAARFKARYDRREEELNNETLKTEENQIQTQ